MSGKLTGVIGGHLVLTPEVLKQQAEGLARTNGHSLGRWFRQGCRGEEFYTNECRTCHSPVYVDTSDTQNGSMSGPAINTLCRRNGSIK